MGENRAVMKFSLKKAAVSLFVSLVLLGVAFAVRYGEDNQVGSSNDISLWIFFLSGVFAYHCVFVLFFLLLGKIKRSRKDKKS
jgi:hypothetical protein